MPPVATRSLEQVIEGLVVGGRGFCDQSPLGERPEALGIEAVQPEQGANG